MRVAAIAAVLCFAMGAQAQEVMEFPAGPLDFWPEAFGIDRAAIDANGNWAGIVDLQGAVTSYIHHPPFPTSDRYLAYLADMGEMDYCTSGICQGKPTKPVKPPKVRAGQAANTNGGGAGTTQAQNQNQEEDDRTSFPYVVALTNSSNGVVCSGTIIGEKAVLTAAHCTCDGDTPVKAFIGSSTYEGDRASVGYEAWYELSGTVTTFTPDYCYYRDRRDMRPVDLAVIYLKDGQSFPGDYRAWIPFDMQMFGGYGEATIVGFGASNQNSSGGVKGFATTNVKPCMAVNDQNSVGCYYDSELAAINEEGNFTDTCKGDSGGPLLYAVGGGYALVGVTSRQIGNGYAEWCGDGGIYTSTEFSATELGMQIQYWIRSVQR